MVLCPWCLACGWLVIRGGALHMHTHAHTQERQLCCLDSRGKGCEASLLPCKAGVLPAVITKSEHQ